jgi:hypothetical protein
MVALLLELGAPARALNGALELPVDVVGSLGGSPFARECDPAAVRRLFLDRDPALELLVLHHPECLDHQVAAGHQEAPEVSSVRASTPFEGF